MFQNYLIALNAVLSTITLVKLVRDGVKKPPRSLRLRRPVAQNCSSNEELEKKLADLKTEIADLRAFRKVKKEVKP